MPIVHVRPRCVKLSDWVTMFDVCLRLHVLVMLVVRAPSAFTRPVTVVLQYAGDSRSQGHTHLMCSSLGEATLSKKDQ